jgi:hypothetical protein
MSAFPEYIVDDFTDPQNLEVNQTWELLYRRYGWSSDAHLRESAMQAAIEVIRGTVEAESLVAAWRESNTAKHFAKYRLRGALVVEVLRSNEIDVCERFDLPSEMIGKMEG